MNFEKLVGNIEQTHKHFQQHAAKAVNVSLTVRNWLIGFYIVEFELFGDDRAVYGQKLFDELTLRLKSIKGIDRRSLYRFKDFYKLYPYVSQYIVENNISLSTPEFKGIPTFDKITPNSETFENVVTPSPQLKNTKKNIFWKIIQSRKSFNQINPDPDGCK